MIPIGIRAHPEEHLRTVETDASDFLSEKIEGRTDPEFPDLVIATIERLPIAMQRVLDRMSISIIDDDIVVKSVTMASRDEYNCECVQATTIFMSTENPRMILYSYVIRDIAEKAQVDLTAHLTRVLQHELGHIVEGRTDRSMAMENL